MTIERFPMWKTALSLSLSLSYFNPKYKQNIVSFFFIFLLRYAIIRVWSADTKSSLKHFYVVLLNIYRIYTTHYQ